MQAASLIDALQVYGDDGDNLFEPATDPLLASASVAGIGDYGVVWVDLVDYHLGAAIPPVAERTFFVALDLADPFLFAAPRTLRATLLTDGASVWMADDREYELPLDLQWRQNLATATVTVLDALFAHGFESGDTDGWSSVQP